MEKLICASCGATLVPDVTQPVLTCEYCGTSAPNAYYDGSAKPAASSLDETAVTILVEMGQSQRLDSDNFGNPLREAYAVRDAMDIPSQEKVYFQLIRSNLLYTVAEGIALTDGRLYYKLDGETGSLSWEAFITGAIACTDMLSRQQAGTLTIGSSLSFPIDSEEDSRLARFLIDFHNRVYQQHTGQAAPAGWTVTQPAAAQTAPTLNNTLGKITLGGVVASAAKSLLQRSTAQRHIVQRPTLTRTVRTPVRQQRHFQPEPPPRPARPPMHQPGHQQRPAQPGGMFRHGTAPGRKGGHGGHGGMVGPGPGRRR